MSILGRIVGKFKRTPTDSSKRKSVSAASVNAKLDDVLTKIHENEASEQELRWLEDLHRALAIKKHFSDTDSNKRPARHVFIALVCILVAGLLLFFRVGDIPAISVFSTNNISIQVRCSSVRISLLDSERPNMIDFDELIRSDRLEMDNLNAIVVSNASIAIYDSIPSLSLELSADSMFLDAIDIRGESVVKIEQFRDMVRFATFGGSVAVSASFNRAELSEPVKQVIRSRVGSDIPLFGRFETLNNLNTEVSIKLRQQGPINILKGKRINSLSFSSSYVYGADILRDISSIQGGALTFNDVGKRLEFDKRDRLLLGDLEGWIIECGIEDGSIDLLFKGSARAVRVGQAGSEKDLRPSVLEYLFKNKPLALFWGVVVFLWSLLNGVVSRVKSS